MNDDVRNKAERSDPPGNDAAGNDPPLPRFPPGQVVATPGALRALASAGLPPEALLARHLRGDWGELDGHDRRENERSLVQGLRLFSSYVVGEGVRVWIITEADRSATTLLLPEDY